jgi:multidrug efflux pump subunit AcrA (membrane-fusion protein)
MEGQSQAALFASQQVESIVAAAQGAADELTRQAQAEAEQIRAAAQAEAEHATAEAQRQAAAAGLEARQSANSMLEEARTEAEQTREQARRAAESRVAAAEEAAEQVLSEAKVLSTGLRRLGESLSEQGERILRDVTAAHRRMQGDLRVGPSDEPRPARSETRPRSRTEERIMRPADPREEELLATVRQAEEQREGDRPARRPAAGRENPIEDLDVPNWVDT